MWTNRTKTWATQSDTYTNPNMTSLLRVNYTILDPSNNNFSSPQNPFGCPSNTIQDGGNLVCNRTVNPCTQEIIKKTVSQQLCNPTTDSDVPGQIQPLCWNDGTQTWYPRQRYIMPTSGTKWPQGYKGFTSALTPAAPVLSLGIITCVDLDIPLNWTFLNSTCAPITSFNIYQNGTIILNVPVTQTSVTITGNPPGTYMYYITSISNTFESEPSNNVEAYINYSPLSPTNITYTFCYKQATISWINTDPSIIGYNIYKDGSNIGTVLFPNSTYTYTNLTNGNSYLLQVSAYNNCNESGKVGSLQILPPTSSYFTGGSAIQSGSNYIITFTSSGTLTYSCEGVTVNCNLLLVGGGGGGAGAGKGLYFPTNYDGGGGGGGGFIYNSAFSFSTSSNSVIVGDGGLGGQIETQGVNGGQSSFNSTIIGGGGRGGFPAPISTRGAGDGYGGTGGQGLSFGGPGYDGEDSSLIPYSGGGGGGSNYGDGANTYDGGGGFAGISGIGGAGGSTSSPSENGQNATTYGSGGGGGGSLRESSGIGGSGFKGIVILTIPN